MNFYLKLLIKILEKSMTAKDSEILKKLKSGYDLSSEEKKELEDDHHALCPDPFKILF